MANTYTSLHYHVIFSTKNRVDWIGPDIEGVLFAIFVSFFSLSSGLARSAPSRAKPSQHQAPLREEPSYDVL